MALTTTTDFPQINGIPIGTYLRLTSDQVKPYENLYIQNGTYTGSFTEPKHECESIQRMSEQYRSLKSEGLLI